MLHIREVNHPLLLLLLCHPAFKIQHQVQQCIYRSPACGALSDRKLQVCGKKAFPQPLEALLHLSPHLPGKVPLHHRYTGILFGGKPAKIHRFQLHRVLLQRMASQQSLHLFQLPIHQLSVLPGTVRLLTQCPNLLQLLRASRDHTPQMFPEPEGIGAFIHLFRRASGIVSFSRLQPRGGPWKAGRIPGQIQNMLLQHPFLPSRAEVFHAEPKSFPAGDIGILYQFLQGLLLHQPDFSLVCNTKSRVQPDFIEMIPQQKQAEAVDCGNLGIVQQRGLPLNMFGIRAFRQPGGNPCRNPFPHLRSGRVGKCDNQQPVDVHRLCLVTDHPHDALHQHRGLAASGRRGYQDIPAMQFDGLLLFRCKCNCHFLCPFPILTEAVTQESSMNASYFSSIEIIFPSPTCRAPSRIVKNCPGTTS